MQTRPDLIGRRLLWAGMLGLGFGTLWVVLLAWVGTSIAHLWHTPDINENFVLNRDGTPLIQWYSHGDLAETKYRNIDGKPVDTVDVDEDDELNHGVELLGRPSKQPGSFWSLDWDRRIRVFVDPKEKDVIWYFVHDGSPDGRGYFVGYNRISKLRIGFIGEVGFDSRKPPIEQRIPLRGTVLQSNYANWAAPQAYAYLSDGRVESVSGRSSRKSSKDFSSGLVFIPSGSRVRAVNLTDRTVRTVFESAEPIESLGILTSPCDGPNEERLSEQLLVLRTTSKVYTLNRTYDVLRAFAIPREIGSNRRLTWYWLGNGKSLIYFSRRAEATDGTVPSTLYSISADGSVESMCEFMMRQGVAQSDKGNWAFVQAGMCPSPLVLSAFLLGLMPGQLVETKQAKDFSQAVGIMLREGWLALFAVAILGTLIAVWGRRRNRRFGLSIRQNNAWTVFLFLFGIPGLAGYLLHRRWPTLAECPSCHKAAPRDREFCATCDSPFPEPELRGIEIFA